MDGTAQFPMNHPGNPPQKKSKALWIVLGVIGGVFLLCCGIGAVLYAAGDGADPAGQNQQQAGQQQQQTAPSPEPANQPQGRPEAGAKIGTPVRDGKFEFIVKGVKCGVAKVGSEYFNKSAQGQFCVVKIEVKNIGDEARTFSAGNQRGFGVNSVKYNSDEVASMYANENNESFLNEINPGNTIVVDIVFDIAKDGQLLALELHDSAFSGGVKVGLA